MPKLILKKNGSVVRKLSVSGDILAFTVGSEPGNDIVVEDPQVSFFHLQFEKQGDEYYVRDLQSQNGTYVNGNLIQKRTEIKHHFEIGLGGHRITFLQDDEATATLPENSYAATHQHAKAHVEDRAMGIPELVNLNSSLQDDVEVARKEKTLHEENAPPARLNENPLPDETETTTTNGKTEQPLNDIENFLENLEMDFMTDDSEGSDLSDTALPAISETVEDVPDTKSDAFGDLAAGDDSIPDVRKNGRAPGRTTFYLLGIQGFYLGKKFRVRKSHTRIGRDKYRNDIVIQRGSNGKLDASISRRHATISFKKDRYWLRDRRSKTRTSVNNYEPSPNEEIALQPGDEIEIQGDGKNHIFRFVLDEQWDFSYPRKAGNWFTRNKSRLLPVLSLTTIAAAVFLLYQSYQRIRISSPVAELQLVQSVWYDESASWQAGKDKTNTIASGIADFNRDGFPDFAFVDSEGFLKVVNGKNKTILWESDEFRVAENSAISIEDLFLDGYADIILVSEDQRIRAIDGQWGIEIWKSPMLPGPLNTPVTVADLNQDTLKDIAVTSGEKKVYIGLSGSGNPKWREIVTDDATFAIPAILGPTANTFSLLYGTESGSLVFIDAGLLSVTKNIALAEIADAGSTYANPVRSPVLVDFLNRDLSRDLVITTREGHLLTINGATGKTLWSQPNPDPAVETPLAAKSALADLDGDGLTDIVTIMPTGTVRAFDGAGRSPTGQLLIWELRNQEQIRYDDLALSDFNGDGQTDVLITSRKGHLALLDGKTGHYLDRMQLNHEISSAPRIADLDSDGSLDIVTGSKGRFVKVSSNTPCLAGTITWGQDNGDSRNSNLFVASPPQRNLFIILMGLAVVIIFTVLLAYLLAIGKRRNLTKALTASRSVLGL